MRDMTHEDLNELDRLLMMYLTQSISPTYRIQAKQILHSVRLIKSQRLRRTREVS